MRNLEIRQKIGTRLLEERTRLCLSQQALADAIGGSRLSVSNYENGRSSPAAETMAAMEAIGVDIRFVLTGLRSAPSAIDRNRFRQAFIEVQRQVKANNEKLDVEACLSHVWRIYDALEAIA
ncbi:helix-turn-helix transcriptional regulator [Herbaspirillum sp. WKF16]|uniref:helix-turn-helix transcriptional regulator n=1 Tax=Herbaspirillum sp. WKF16 TaxID=3028312 RepID=UPI0023A963B8|nr:helix-turn-helix transcriptional regulator [Herbaspirillum sp. WKF16]WDZ96210.1 helix-turn-helix transcriptional regulator [Herbaspirillum sp. WKF16]